MRYTPDEVAELLKGRPAQPHYIRYLVRRAIEDAYGIAQASLADAARYRWLRDSDISEGWISACDALRHEPVKERIDAAIDAAMKSDQPPNAISAAETPDNSAR